MHFLPQRGVTWNKPNPGDVTNFETFAFSPFFGGEICATSSNWCQSRDPHHATKSFERTKFSVPQQTRSQTKDARPHTQPVSRVQKFYRVTFTSPHSSPHSAPTASSRAQQSHRFPASGV
jgi:hypothetical protein